MVVIAVVVAAVLWWRSIGVNNQLIPPGQLGPPVSETDTTSPIGSFAPGARTYGGSADDSFDAVALNSDGTIIVAGYSPSTDGDFVTGHYSGPTLLAKLTPQGDLVWSTAMGGSDSDYFYGVAINTDGTIIAAGYASSTDGDFAIAPGHGDDALLAKYSADGDLIWAKTFGGNGHDQFHAVAIGPDGTIAAAGFTASTNGDFPVTKGDRSVLVATFSPDGDLEWAKISGTNGRDEFDGLAIESDGTIIAGGVTSSTNGDFPVKTTDPDDGSSVIAAYSATGKLLWHSTATNGSWAVYWALTLTNDGSIIATGTSLGGPTFTKFSQNGDTLWTTELTDMFSSDFSSAAQTVDDSIIAVGGQYQQDSSEPLALVAEVNADGQLVWAKTMGGSGFNNFQGVKVDADGNIIAVGLTDSLDGEFPAAHGGLDAVVARMNGSGSLG